jgi:hypothetical protein
MLLSFWNFILNILGAFPSLSIFGSNYFNDPYFVCLSATFDVLTSGTVWTVGDVVYFPSVNVYSQVSAVSSHTITCLISGNIAPTGTINNITQAPASATITTVTPHY